MNVRSQLPPLGCSMFVTFFFTPEVIAVWPRLEGGILGYMQHQVIHALRTPNEGMNQRNLKCLGRMWQTNRLQL